jgi:hypothetical protein
MQAIEADPQNRMASVTIDNMTAPRAGGQQAAMADPFQMQVPQSTIPGI